MVVSSGAPGRQEEERNVEVGPWGRPGEIGLRGRRNFRALLRRSCFFDSTVDVSPLAKSSSGVSRTRSSRIGVVGAAELKDNRLDSAVKEMAVGVPMEGWPAEEYEMEGQPLEEQEKDGQLQEELENEGRPKDSEPDNVFGNTSERVAPWYPTVSPASIVTMGNSIWGFGVSA